MKQSRVKQGRLPEFKYRFKELQGTMSNTEFAEFLGMSRQTVGFYLNGDRIPDALALKQIAERCQVSADFLIGLSDIKPTELNQETAASLGLPERFIAEVCFARDRSFLLEVQALQGILGADGFWEAISCLSNVLFELEKNVDGLDGQLDPESIPNIRKMDTEVRQATNNVFCACRRSWFIEGLKFRAQEAFNAAVEHTLVQANDKRERPSISPGQEDATSNFDISQEEDTSAQTD